METIEYPHKVVGQVKPFYGWLDNIRRIAVSRLFTSSTVVIVKTGKIVRYSPGLIRRFYGPICSGRHGGVLALRCPMPGWDCFFAEKIYGL